MSVKLRIEHRLEFLSLKGDYSSQNATLLDITCHGSNGLNGNLVKLLSYSVHMWWWPFCGHLS